MTMAHIFAFFTLLFIASVISGSNSLPNKQQLVKPRIKCADPHCDKLTIKIDGAGRHLEFHLAKNNYLFTPEYKVETTRSFGDNLVDCHYQLDSGHGEEGFAAMSICNNQLNGMFSDASGTRFELSFDQQTNSTVLRELEESPTIKSTCGVEDSVKTKVPTMYDSDFQSSKEFPNAFVKLLLVTDFEVYSKQMQSNIQISTMYNHLLVNTMNALYAPLRIHIILAGIETWTTKNEIDYGLNISYTLDNFADFSSKNYASRHDYDLAMLNFGHNFESAIAGLAYLGQVCRGSPSDVVGAVTYLDHRGKPRRFSVLADTITHEVGHILGFNHVSETCKCSSHKKGTCIMSATGDEYVSTEWSECTKSRLRDIYGRGLNQCLLKKPNDAIHALAICGNGVLEEGEECDCPQGDTSCRRCCDVETCKLHPSSKCSWGECCSNCQLNAKGTQCANPGINPECNLPSTCDGSTSSCPLNTPRPDLTKCTDRTHAGNCFKGACVSRGGRCFDIWGDLVTPSELKSYALNLNNPGTPHGHCGKNFNHMTPCNFKDILCGQMKCDANNFERDHEALEKAALRRGSFMWSTIDETLSVTFENNDIHLTPEGSQCGETEICSQVKCVEVGCQENCNGQGKCVDGQCVCNPGFDGPFCSKRCPQDCNRHGYCNKDGTCNCLQGFAPPNCVDTTGVFKVSSDQPSAKNPPNMEENPVDQASTATQLNGKTSSPSDRPPTEKPHVDKSSSSTDTPEPIEANNRLSSSSIVAIVATLIVVLAAIAIVGIVFYVKRNHSKASKDVQKIKKEGVL